MTSVVIPADEPDGRLSLPRRIGGFAIAVVGTVTTSVALLPDRERIGPESVLLVLVLISVVASAVGGIPPAVTAAVLGFLAVNLFFTPPYGTLSIQRPVHLVDLIVFVGIAVGVGLIVELGSRARMRASRERALRTAIAELGRREAGDHDNVDRFLADLIDELGVDRAELVGDGTPVAVAGGPQGDRVAARLPAGDRLELHLYGKDLHDTDPDLLVAYGTTAGRLWRWEELLAELERRTRPVTTSPDGAPSATAPTRAPASRSPGSPTRPTGSSH